MSYAALWGHKYDILDAFRSFHSRDSGGGAGINWSRRDVRVTVDLARALLSLAWLPPSSSS